MRIIWKALPKHWNAEKWEISLSWIEYKMNEPNFNNLPYSFANSQNSLSTSSDEARTAIQPKILPSIPKINNGSVS